MSPKIRKMTRDEASQAEELTGLLAEELEKVCMDKGIENIGVILSAITALAASVMITSLEPEDWSEASGLFKDNLDIVIDNRLEMVDVNTTYAN